jgi:hypothetical protein
MTVTPKSVRWNWDVIIQEAQGMYIAEVTIGNQRKLSTQKVTEHYYTRWTFLRILNKAWMERNKDNLSGLYAICHCWKQPISYLYTL